ERDQQEERRTPERARSDPESERRRLGVTRLLPELDPRQLDFLAHEGLNIVQDAADEFRDRSAFSEEGSHTRHSSKPDASERCRETYPRSSLVSPCSLCRTPCRGLRLAP